MACVQVCGCKGISVDGRGKPHSCRGAGVRAAAAVAAVAASVLAAPADAAATSPMHCNRQRTFQGTLTAGAARCAHAEMLTRLQVTYAGAPARKHATTVCQGRRKAPQCGRLLRGAARRKWSPAVAHGFQGVFQCRGTTNNCWQSDGRPRAEAGPADHRAMPTQQREPAGTALKRAPWTCESVWKRRGAATGRHKGGDGGRPPTLYSTRQFALCTPLHLLDRTAAVPGSAALGFWGAAAEV
jgi:hypothetical protein